MKASPMIAIYASLAAMVVIVGVLVSKLDDGPDPLDQNTLRR